MRDLTSTTHQSGQAEQPSWADSVLREQQISAEANDAATQIPLTPPSSPPSYQMTMPPGMSRSKSQPQALPYHRPWNRHLASSSQVMGAAAGEDQEYNPQRTSKHTASTSYSPSKAAAVARLDPSRTWSQSTTRETLPSLYDSILIPPSNAMADFRISSHTLPRPTPAQRKQVIDAARRVSLKRAKAPCEFNILVVGGRMTGKTSFIRTLLSTCDLHHCSEEVRIAAAHFGIASSSSHPTRRTDPITPLATKSFNYLGGIELQANSLLPLSSLDQGGNTSTEKQEWFRQQSLASARTSIFSTSTGSNTQKLQISICDTPGIDFEIEDDFEVDRRVSKIVKYVEGKFLKTLSEEGKIQRKLKSEDHIHLILYFIDPRHLSERTDSRRKEVRQGRSKGRPTHEDRRARSQSESNANGRIPGGILKRNNSSNHVEGEVEESQEEKDFGVEGLSFTEIGILSKLSKYANVLPIVAKGDTLSLSRSYEVRNAVRKSLKVAKVDLGVFDFASIKTRKKRLSTEGETAIPDDEQQERLNGESNDVKVIRVRSKRSYSSNNIRPTSAAMSSTMSHGEESETGSSSLYDTTGFQQTEPLFQNDAVDDEDEADRVKSHEELMRHMPLSIFVPEPMQVYRKKKSSLFSKRPGSGGREEDVDTVYSKIPPVPPLPRNTSDHAIPSSTRTNLNNAKEELLDERQQLTLAISPNPAAFSASLPTALLPSSRYERNYRWGSAHVLDPEHCDFGLLRTTILGTHLEQLRESTSMRYEAFRTRRLELNRLLREGQNPS